jgi:hypothetical protein
MEHNRTLIDEFVHYQSKSSAIGPSCQLERLPNFPSDLCYEAIVCYIRSGTVAMGQACPKLFGTTQHNLWPAHKRDIAKGKKEAESKNNKNQSSLTPAQISGFWAWALSKDAETLDTVVERWPESIDPN